jgi:hypothetical protein
MSRPTYFFSRSQGTRKDPLEGKFASSESPSTQAPAEEAVPLSTFAGLYWFVELDGKHEALSTEEVANAMDGGGTVRATSGPFPTREEAAQSLERYWEMSMDDDDDDDAEDPHSLG